MADLIIYDSSRAESKRIALIALLKYPAATLKDFTGLAASSINTYIGALDAAGYDKIIMCINTTLVEEVVATAVVTFTAGAANEIGYINIANAGGDVLLQVAYTTAADTDTADAILAKTAINDATATHGFSAENAAGVLTISAPAGTGVTGDTYVCTVDADTGGTLALVVTTDFSAASTGVTQVGVTGDITEEDFIDAEPAITAAAVATGTAAAVGNSTITLAVGSSAVNDYYKGMTVMTEEGGTGNNQVRTIISYVGATRVATIDYAWGTNPTGNTYIISQDLLFFGRTVNSQSAFFCAWETIIGLAYDTPAIVEILKGAGFYAKNDKTSTGTAAGTLTDTTEFTSGDYTESTTDDKPDYYIGVKSSNTARTAGQIVKIASNTTSIITLDENWAITPHATSTVYQIGHLKYMLWDEYLVLAFEKEMNFSGDTLPTEAMARFKKITDRYGKIASGGTHLYQDDVYLDELAAIGKIIFDAQGEGVVT